MVTLNQTYTYEEIMQCIYELECRYSDLLKLSVIGYSHDERKIPMLQMGTSDKCLICSAGIHGRESVNPILMLKIIEDYCMNPEAVHKLMETYSICFLPLMNPDGYEIALCGYQSIRNPIYRHTILMDGIPYEEWKFNGRGVDINRNFPCKSFRVQGRMLYPGSENETQALIGVFRQFPNSVGYIDFHSRGQIIYCFRGAMPASYNKESERMARHLQSLAHYDLGSSGEEFGDASSGGNSVNYYSEVFHKLALTVETVADEAVFPLDTEYQIHTYEEIKKIPFSFLERI